MVTDQLEIAGPHVSSPSKESCGDNQELLMGMHDALDVLTGKWKLHLLGTLIFGGKKRFMDLLRDMDGIAAKMLSKELHDLEIHQLVKRTVKDTKPVTVEYEITEYGKSMEPVIIEITNGVPPTARKF
ncbi:MAG: helix-turn-helix domain-containing protein [Bacteroidota bacterium]